MNGLAWFIVDKLAADFEPGPFTVFRPIAETGELLVMNADELLVRVSAKAENEVWVSAGSGALFVNVVADEDSMNDIKRIVLEILEGRAFEVMERDPSTDSLVLVGWGLEDETELVGAMHSATASLLPILGPLGHLRRRERDE